MGSLTKGIARMENSRILTAIKKGFVVMIPILMVGALSLLLRSFPLAFFQHFLQTFLGGALFHILNLIYNATFGMMSLYLTVSISYQYACAVEKTDPPFRIFAVLVSASCFVLSFPGEDGLLDFAAFGPNGVFMAMVCAIAATKLFYKLYELLRRFSHKDAAVKEVDLQSAIAAIVPMLGCILVFVAGNNLLHAAFHVRNINELISLGFIKLFRNGMSQLMSGLLFIFSLHFLWLFGIHGGNVMDQVAQQIFVPNDTNPVMVVSKSFMDNFAMLGGCGGTICLLLALFFTSKMESNRRLAKSCFPFALFNINELLVFGFPLVLNPVMAIPFLLVPLLSLLNAYFFTAVGLLPVVQANVAWTTPVFLSGYAAVNSGWGIVVQVINIAAGTLLYIPFLRLSERMLKQKDKLMLATLVTEFKKAEANGADIRFLDRQDALGTIARHLVGDLRAAIEKNAIPVYYQPQVDALQQVCGAEALLRWSYGGELVYPPLVISLAKEAQLNDPLAHCIISTVLTDLPAIAPSEGPPFLVSANITAEQLDNPEFVSLIIAMARESRACSRFGLEVTEATSLIYLEHITQNIQALKEEGIPMSIDDFSMGQTSLKYLQDNSFGFVKLDGGLVMESQVNERSREIILSIIKLGKSLHYQVVAEHVETQALKDDLESMGCDFFQGYLFGPAVPAGEFLKFLPTCPKE